MGRTTLQTPIGSCFTRELAPECCRRRSYVDWPLEDAEEFSCPENEHTPEVWVPSIVPDQLTANFDATSGEKSDRSRPDKFAFAFMIRNQLGKPMTQRCGAAKKPCQKKDGYIELYAGSQLVEDINPEDTPNLLIRGDSQEAWLILRDLWKYHLENKAKKIKAGDFPEATIIANLRKRRQKSYKRQHIAELAVSILCTFDVKYSNSKYILEFQLVAREANMSMDRMAQSGHKLEIGQSSPDLPDDWTLKEYLKRDELGIAFCRFLIDGCIICGDVKHQLLGCPFLRKKRQPVAAAPPSLQQRGQAQRGQAQRGQAQRGQSQICLPQTTAHSYVPKNQQQNQAAGSKLVSVPRNKQQIVRQPHSFAQSSPQAATPTWVPKRKSETVCQSHSTVQSSHQAEPSKQVEYCCFVGGLAPEIDDSDLRNAFQYCGNIVVAEVKKDILTGESRLFGFVTFDTEKSMLRAIGRMDGIVLRGKTIKVQENFGTAKSQPGGGSSSSR